MSKTYHGPPGIERNGKETEDTRKHAETVGRIQPNVGKHLRNNNLLTKNFYY